MQINKNVNMCLFLIITALICSKTWHDTQVVFLTTSVHQHNTKELKIAQQKVIDQSQIELNYPSVHQKHMDPRDIFNILQTNAALQDKIKELREIDQNLYNQGKAFVDNTIICNAFGLTIGAFFAGMLTNAFGAPTVLPIAMLIIMTLSLLLMICTKYMSYGIIMFVIYALAFLRGAAISSSMNAVYAYLGILYKDNKPALVKATSILYTSLFLMLGFIPYYAQTMHIKFYNILAFICMITAVLLAFNRNAFTTKQQKAPFNFAHECKEYILSFPVLFKNPNFIVLCFMSMLCIGGFYNLLYIIKQIPQYVPYCTYIQRYGRLFASLTISCMNYIPSIIGTISAIFAKTAHQINYMKYMRISFNVLSAIGISMIFHAIIAKNLFELIAGFILTFASASASQVFTKSDIISVANAIMQETNKTIIGSAQAVVTLSNSIFEFLGSMLILKIANGSFIYLTGCIMLYLFIIMHQSRTLE